MLMLTQASCKREFCKLILIVKILKISTPKQDALSSTQLQLPAPDKSLLLQVFQ